MPLERRMSRDIFAPGEIVELKQMCLTPSKMFAPGKYKVDDLPDTAFEMGLVEKLPSVKGKNAETKNTETPPEKEGWFPPTPLNQQGD